MCRTLNSILKHDTTIISLFLLGKTCSVTIFGRTIKFKKLCCWGWENLCSSIWNKMIVNIATVCQMNHTSIILKYAVSGNSVVIKLSVPRIIFFIHSIYTFHMYIPYNDINITSLEKAPSYDIHIMLNKSQLLFHKIQNKSYRSLKRTFTLTINFFLLNRI